MEKQLKKIADELQLIRKEMQKNNRPTKIENTVMMESEPILSNDELIQSLTGNLAERLKRI